MHADLSRVAGALLILLVCVAAAAAQTSRPFELRASTMTVNSTAQTVEARGNVRVSDGRIVATAPRAIYYLRDRRIVLLAGVIVTSPNGILRGREVTVFLGRGNTIDRLEAAGAVTFRSGPRTLQAARVAYHVAADQLTASGAVQLKTPDGTMAGDQLEAAGASRQAIMRGHVRAVFGTTQLTSETATLFEREKKVIFRGKVRITRPGRILLADVVTFYYAENRLVAEGQTRILIQQSP